MCVCHMHEGTGRELRARELTNVGHARMNNQTPQISQTSVESEMERRPRLNDSSSSDGESRVRWWSSWKKSTMVKGKT